MSLWRLHHNRHILTRWVVPMALPVQVGCSYKIAARGCASKIRGYLLCGSAVSYLVILLATLSPSPAPFAYCAAPQINPSLTFYRDRFLGVMVHHPLFIPYYVCFAVRQFGSLLNYITRNIYLDVFLRDFIPNRNRVIAVRLTTRS